MNLTHFFYFVVTVGASLIISVAIAAALTGVVAYYDIGNEIHQLVVFIVTIVCNYRPFYLKGKKLLGFEFAN